MLYFFFCFQARLLWYRYLTDVVVAVAAAAATAIAAAGTAAAAAATAIAAACLAQQAVGLNHNSMQNLRPFQPDLILRATSGVTRDTSTHAG